MKSGKKIIWMMMMMWVKSFFFNFGSKSPLVAGFFVLERKRIFNFSETLNTFCSWKINVPMYGVLWGLLFKWKKIRCQVWKFRFFFKLCFGICGIFLKFQISGFRACFSFRQALSRLALLTLLCCLAAALPGVQARRRFVLLRWDTYIGYRVSM